MDKDLAKRIAKLAEGFSEEQKTELLSIIRVIEDQAILVGYRAGSDDIKAILGFDNQKGC